VNSTAAPAAAALLQRLLQAADAKAADVAELCHPAWVDAAWRHLGLDAGQARRVPQRRHAALLAEVYGLGWPALADLQTPAHRLALLGRRQIVRVLAIFTLHARRDSVRRSIGRDVRRLLVEGIGEPAYQHLLNGQAQALPSIQPLAAHELDLERLAAAGYRALCTQGAWRCRKSLAITRLSLAPTALDGAGDPAGTKTRIRSTGSGADGVFDRLPDYFPEHAWLFGSDMGRALSA
jgi:hypothetical protein